MALPKQVAPSYVVELPSNKTEVTYRPMTMKQQKSLLVALESEDNLQMLRSMRDLLSDVTEGKFDAYKAPMVDLEYLFLQVRAKSVGETVNLNLKCKEEACEGSTQIEIDLTSIGVVESDTVETHRIMLNDTLGIEMRYPTPELLSKLQDKDDDMTQLTQVMKSTIVSIFDNLEVHPLDDADPREVEEFLDNLTIDQVSQITDYYDRMPKLSHTIDFACSDCGKEQKRVLQGIASFF